MEKIFATPKEGMLVRQENGKPLAAEGESVDRNSFWLRRERDGDVTLGPVPHVVEEAVAEPAAPSGADQTMEQAAIVEAKPAKKTAKAAKAAKA